MTLEKALRYVVLASIFALPFIALYVSRSMFFPFITGKNFAFRLLVEIMTGAWIVLALYSPQYRSKRSWLVWAFGIFVIIIGIADAFGVYPFKSFWSNYERMEGWVTLLHLFVYFVVAVSVLSTEKLWKHFWHTSLGASFLVACYGLMQLAGFKAISQSTLRLDATLGNSTYLGVYMLFHVFIGALLLSRAWVDNGKGRRIAPALLYGGIIALDSFILFFTATRGAILGLLGGALLSAVILIILAPRSRIAWRLGAIIAGFFVIVGAFWMVRDQAWVKNIEPLARLATIVDGTSQSRFRNWNMAWQGVKERPILGWGQENYAAVFDKYYDPNMYGQEPWFDRVHNIVLDWLIAGGILGLLGYLSLFFFSLLAIWRSGAFAPYERAILTGLFAGYFFYNLFTFDNITSYILFVSILAYVTVRAGENTPVKNDARTISPKVVPFVCVVAIALVWGTAWFVNARALAQNRALIQAISPHQEGPLKNLEYFKQAAAYRSVGTQEVREQLSQAAISIVDAQSVPTDIKQAFAETAIQEMNIQSEEAKYNARSPFFVGILLDHAGAYAEAKNVLEEARKRSPKKQSILFELGLNAVARKANDEALMYFKEAHEIAPQFKDGQLYYAAALIRAGKDAEADAFIQELMKSDSAADARISSAYVARKQFDKVAAIYTAHIEKHPDDVQARFTLAGAYYAGGNSAAAIRALEETKKAIPSTAEQVDQLIEQVRTGTAQVQ